MTEFNPMPLAQALIRAPSVTPDDNGSIDVVIAALEPLGFACEKLIFTGNDGPDTVNLFAYRDSGKAGPHFCFAGHTDVVPAGDKTAWTHDPFGAVVENDILYGRGAEDMKGAIAAFITAAANFTDHPGAISLVITGNEEGNCRNGTPRVLEWLKEKNIKLSHCIVGEPTSEARVGDVIKNGRRGHRRGRYAVIILALCAVWESQGNLRHTATIKGLRDLLQGSNMPELNILWRHDNGARRRIYYS